MNPRPVPSSGNQLTCQQNTSKIAALSPIRATPTTDTPDPNLHAALTDSELPNMTKSNTDAWKIDPTLSNPETDADELRRTKLRRDNELPRTPKLATASAEPIWETPMTDTEEPKRAKPRSEKEDPR